MKNPSNHVQDRKYCLKKSFISRRFHPIQDGPLSIVRQIWIDVPLDTTLYCGSEVLLHVQETISTGKYISGDSSKCCFQFCHCKWRQFNFCSASNYKLTVFVFMFSISSFLWKTFGSNIFIILCVFSELFFLVCANVPLHWNYVRLRADLLVTP